MPILYWVCVCDIHFVRGNYNHNASRYMHLPSIPTEETTLSNNMTNHFFKYLLSSVSTTNRVQTRVKLLPIHFSQFDFHYQAHTAISHF